MFYVIRDLPANINQVEHRINHTSNFVQAKTAHTAYVSQRAKDDFQDLMADIDKMKSVNNLFSMDAGKNTTELPSKIESTGSTDLFDCLEIGPNGELMLKYDNSSTTSPILPLAKPVVKGSNGEMSMASEKMEKKKEQEKKENEKKEDKEHVKLRQESAAERLKVTVTRYAFTY